MKKSSKSSKKSSPLQVKRKREVIGVYGFPPGGQPYQGDTSHLGNFRLTVTRQRVKYPYRNGAESPVMKWAYIASVKLGNNTYVASTGTTGYEPAKAIRLAGNDEAGRAAVSKLKPVPDTEE